MSPNAILNIFPPKPTKLVGRVTDSVTDNRSGFPPKQVKSVEIASNSVAEKKLAMQLVFTEFGLSPVAKMPSTEELLLSPAKLYTTPHSKCPFSLLEKVESPRSHQQENMKADNVANKNRKQCHCKRSRCLKLYCECFASGAYCDGCDCNCCRNNVDNEALRQAAMENILERNPNAFRAKIASSPSSPQHHGDDMKGSPMVGKHNWGCRCKKTGCRKNYCECFHAKVSCSKNCKCMDCKNSEEYSEKMFLLSQYNNMKISKNSEGHEKIMVVHIGHNSNAKSSKIFEVPEDKKALTNGDHSKINICKHFEGSQREIAFPSRENNNRKICVRQTSAAISAAIGLSGPSSLQASRKRKLQKILDSNYNDPLIQTLTNHQKVNPLRVSSSVDHIDNVSNSTTQASSKFHCSKRSSFSNIIQAQMEELSSVLAITSEAAEDKNAASDIQAVTENQNTNISEVQDIKNFPEGSNVQNETQDDHWSGNEDDAINIENCVSGDIDEKEGRFLSPGTVAVMYNEKDEAFTGATTPGEILIQGCNANVYIEQERLVLASFRDCLKKIIILGNMKSHPGRVNNPIVKDGTQHE